MAGSEQPEGGGPHGDPSMDDILASIRRILNEDEAPPPPEEDVLRLEPSMMVPAETLPEPNAAPPIPAPPNAAPPNTAHAAPPDPLVAPTTAAATASSMSELVRRLAAERATQVSRDGPTIADLVRQELRPMLTAWLDTHLPPMVERLVRQEIERMVTRAAGGI